MATSGSGTSGPPACRLCHVEHKPGSPQCPHSRVGNVVAERYRLDKLLGVGGMGAVYEAENLSLGRRVALKLLHPKHASDAQTVERFQREARGVAGLNHQGFTQVFSCDTAADGTMYIEMELLVGASVDAVLKQGPIPISRAIALLDSALDALAAAHVAGFVHRDIKPENLFVCRDSKGVEYVEVLDFGIARSMKQSGEQRLTTTGEFMGTVLYASPEQLMDTAESDTRSDVFSFGAAAYEILVGESPASGGSYAEVISRIMIGEHERRPSKKRADVPAWLDDMVSRALEMEPAKRFVHAGVMLDALRSYTGAAAPPIAATDVGAISGGLATHDPWAGPPSFSPHEPPPASGLATGTVQSPAKTMLGFTMKPGPKAVGTPTSMTAATPVATATPTAATPVATTTTTTTITTATEPVVAERKKWIGLALVIGGIVLVIAIVAIAFGGSSKSESGATTQQGSARTMTEKPDAKAFPATEDGARMIVAELRTNPAFAKELAPADADYAAIFEGAAATTAREHYRQMYATKVDLSIKAEQTETLVARATTEQLRAGTASEFPGGYRNIADQLKPNLVFYRWKYVRPGESMGMAFDGLVHVNGHWVWVPKPFRALR